MRITIKDTIIEATAADLSNSNTLADSFSNLLKRVFNSNQDEDNEAEDADISD